MVCDVFVFEQQQPQMAMFDCYLDDDEVTSGA